MNPAAMTFLLGSTLGFFAWSASRRLRQLRLGAPDPDFSLADGQLLARLRDVVVYAFGQRRMPTYRIAGLAHIAIFAGFNVLLLNSVLLWGRGYDPMFDFWGVLAHDAPLGVLYGFLKDTFVVLVLVGLSVFVWYRVVRRGRSHAEGAQTQRMTLGAEGLVILGIIAVMMVADMVYFGAWQVLTAGKAGEPVVVRAEWASSLVALGLVGAPEGRLVVLAQVGFWVHASLVLIFLNILPFSKHFHILTAIPNVFTASQAPKGRLQKVEDLEGRVEREESVGIARLGDLSWNKILDLYTCTECGRCSDNCPAYITDKKLSPKHLTLALRDHLYETEESLFGAADGIAGALRGGPAAKERQPLHANPPAPADAYFRSGEPVELVPNVVHPDVLWACTTCRACEEQCPVMISYVDTIVGMRRELLMIKGEMPAELQRPMMGLETNGNPWNVTASDRGTWAEGLGIPVLREHPAAEILYWVGCAASYDDRAKKTARAVARLLKEAEVDFAILGTEETCTGDPARRAGNEYLFQLLAAQNIETLNGYDVAKKTVVTACPHCFNTLKNEYPDFGGHFDVVHHSDFLNGLLARGKLRPAKRVNATVAFHDSCYLGRYNDVVESPRRVLERIPGVTLVEVPYWNKKKGLCCGAGGGQMFMEEQNENRVNVKRTLQLLETGADTLASGCPFCMTMLTDGLKAQEKDETVRQLDIAELLLESILFRDDDGAAGSSSKVGAIRSVK